jgi:hypothetical protein
MKPSALDVRAVPAANLSAEPVATAPDSNLMSRRVVFAGAGAVGALAAVAVVLPDAASVPVSAAAEPRDADGHGRYQATAHVRRYYQTARV